MHTGYQNIPTDIIRTAVAVAETGSLTRAARQLGISQPAVTSQIKRIEEIVGGRLFAKSSNGSVPTDFGRMFLDQARRMLDANDQMLQLGGRLRGPQPVRLGLSAVFVSDFVTDADAKAVSNITVQVDNCIGIGKSLVDSHIDIACVLDNPKFEADLHNLVIDECSEDIAWVRAPDFQLMPGKPLPISIWSGDHYIINELTRHGLSFHVVVNSRDYYSKLRAAAVGIGITAMPRRLIPESLVAADDFDYLPKLPPIRGLLCARPNLPPIAQALADKISARYFRSNRAAGDRNIPGLVA